MSVAVPMPPAPSHRWDNEDQGPLLDSRTGTFIFFPDLGCVWLLRKIWGLGNCRWEYRHRKEDFIYLFIMFNFDDDDDAIGANWFRL